MNRNQRGKNSNRKTAPRNVRRNTQMDRITPSPPPFDANTNIRKKRFRFRNSSTTTTFDIGDNDLFNLIGLTISTTQCAVLIAALQLKSVSVWASTNPSTGVTFPIKIIPTIGSSGNIGQKPITKIDTPVGTADPARVVWRTRKDEAAGMWQNKVGSVVTGGAAFSLVIPQNAVVDIVMNFVEVNGTECTLTNIATTGPVPPLYTYIYNNLDGLTSSQLVPE